MPEPESSLWRMSGKGMELGLAALVLGGVGWWIDRKYGTEPWGALIGMAVGFSGGLYVFLKEAMALNREAGEQARRHGKLQEGPPPPRRPDDEQAQENQSRND